MTSTTHRLPALVATLGLMLASCSAPLPLDDAPLGVVEGLSPVAPGLVVEASPVVEDGRLRLEIRSALAPADLVFSRQDDGYAAEIPLWFRVRDRQGRETFAAREVTDSLVVGPIEETRSDRQLVFIESFDVPPGRMMAEVILRDPRGEPRATRRFEVLVPAEEELPFVLPPRMLRGEEFMVGAASPRWRLRDDVRVAADVHEPAGQSALVLAITRARADTLVATPPFWINPGRGTLAYRGAAFVGEGVDTVMIIDDVQGAVSLPLLEEGAYSVAVWLRGEERAAQQRPLLVLPEDHPRVETIDAMIDALAYVAYPAELERMRAAPGPFQRREAFDAFWGSLFENRQLAEETMRLYYVRVEEANRLFSSHKSGWMTDRGMIYIVLGAPALVERSLDGEVWRYAGARGVTSESYFFERVPYEAAPWPLDHHVLQRSSRFEPVWQQAVRRWRRGEVR